MSGHIRVCQGFATALALLLFFACAQVSAEPYLAVQKGLKCGTCHTSPSGGGKRTVYGNVYEQAELSQHTLDMGDLWTGDINRFLAVGGDVRGAWSQVDVPGQANSTDAALEEILGYVEIRPFPRHLTLHIDAKLRPDDPVVREKYAVLSTADNRWSIKGGRFFLPHGLRLQDDDAFIRQVTGINFNTPDSGWEFGFEQGRWSAQLAVSRGTAGGPEVDSGKQYSLRISHTTSKWQAGGSLNFNDAKFGDRRMHSLFGGIRTGRVSWLGEFDYIVDEGTPTGRRNLWASLLEANVALSRGHNIKLTAEFFEPDTGVPEDEQNRLSVVWEYFPVQFVQTRIGYRRYNGIPQNPAQNRNQLFVELHLPF